MGNAPVVDYRDWGHTDLDPEWPDRHPAGRAPTTEAGHTRPGGGRHRYEDRHPEDTGEWAYTDEWTHRGEWAYRSEPYARGGPPETGQWRRPPDPEKRDPPSVPAPWDDQSGDPGAWDHSSDTGQWDRLTDTGQWQRDDLISLDRQTEGSQTDRSESFWEGTRLSGDDPRWMATPSSAPRSPAISYPEPPDNLPAIPVPRHAETDTSMRGIADRRYDVNQGGPLAAMLYAAAWYVVPLLILFVWMLTLDGSAPAGCVTDASGGGCESARAHAATSIADGAPRLGAALGASLAAALLLHRVSRAWRATGVGLAAAVIGGGLSIVVFQLTGA